MTWEIQTRERTVVDAGDGEEDYGEWTPWFGYDAAGRFGSFEAARDRIVELVDQLYDPSLVVTREWVRPKEGIYTVHVLREAGSDTKIEHDFKPAMADGAPQRRSST
jgi:hypothetical protein